MANEMQETSARRWGRLLLGFMLVNAGAAHLTYARKEFQAQVPPWLPFDPDDVVLASGVGEIALGTALMALPRQRRFWGRVAASVFVAIFPGNIAQYTERRDAFGLNTDGARLLRLFGQPVLVAWALWATGTAKGRGLPPER